MMKDIVVGLENQHMTLAPIEPLLYMLVGTALGNKKKLTHIIPIYTEMSEFLNRSAK